MIHESCLSDYFSTTTTTTTSNNNFPILPAAIFPNFLFSHFLFLSISAYTGSLQIVDSIRDDQGKFECVAENSVGTEHSKPTSLYIKERRVPPTFSRLPEPLNEVRLGANLSLECVAVGSPMPLVKWKSGADDITPEDEIPVGKNVLELTNIQHSANFTCVAASSLGTIEATAIVKVQCE